MNYLHLDHLFTPFGDSLKFESFIFNGGEPHIKISESQLEDAITITHRIRSFNDLGLLLVATDAVKRMGVKDIELFIPYFPGSRQDRLMVTGESLTVKVYADLINAQQYKRVLIFDPHSDVTPALITNVKVLNNHKYVKHCLGELNDEVVLIAPDGGALKKIYKLSNYLGGLEVIECSKKRYINTGALTGFKVHQDDLRGKHCVIVDDICDGGGTFVGLADSLKRKNAGDLSLIVSHGIFSKGLMPLENRFRNIFSTNSFKDFDDKILTQIPLQWLQ